MTIKGILLAGVALVTLSAAPAFAKTLPGLHVTALHAGHVINKTKAGSLKPSSVTYTFGVSTYVPASVGTTTKLAGTYYKWNSTNGSGSYSICTAPKQKIKAGKASYGKTGTSTETYSLGCSSGPTVFYGDTYKLTKSGHSSDAFVSTLSAKIKHGPNKKAKLILDVSVTI